jgi:prolipoprotein diacylglyceryltransferase
VSNEGRREAEIGGKEVEVKGKTKENLWTFVLQFTLIDVKCLSLTPNHPKYLCLSFLFIFVFLLIFYIPQKKKKKKLSEKEFLKSCLALDFCFNFFFWST